jgi:hypothetical protein
MGRIRESFALTSHSVRLGNDPDLYSDFGIQRISECLRSSKSEVVFSATGRGLRIAKYAAKFDKIGVFLVTSLTIKTSWRRKVDSNHRYRSFLRNKLRVSAHFRRLAITN